MDIIPRDWTDRLAYKSQFLTNSGAPNAIQIKRRPLAFFGDGQAIWMFAQNKCPKVSFWRSGLGHALPKRRQSFPWSYKTETALLWHDCNGIQRKPTAFKNLKFGGWGCSSPLVVCMMPCDPQCHTHTHTTDTQAQAHTGSRDGMCASVEWKRIDV